MKSKKNLHIISHFKTLIQQKDNNCGVVCAKMVLSFYGIETPPIETFTSLCKTRPFPYGTKLIDLIEGIKTCTQNKIHSTYDYPQQKPFEKYSAFKKFVIESIDKNIPIIVENVDFGGHYKVIIGWDELSSSTKEDDVLIFADPADVTNSNGYSFESAERFFYMWFDAHCLEPEAQIQPFIQIFPE